MLRLPPTQLDPARRIRRHPVSELGVVPNFVKRTATNVAQLAETYFRPLSLYLVCTFFCFVILSNPLFSIRSFVIEASNLGRGEADRLVPSIL